MSKADLIELEALGDELLRYVAYGDCAPAEHLRVPAWLTIRRIAQTSTEESRALLEGARAIAAELREWSRAGHTR